MVCFKALAATAKLIAEFHPAKPKKKAVRGCAKGAPETFYMAPDFDAPFEEFKTYMCYI